MLITYAHNTLNLIARAGGGGSGGGGGGSAGGGSGGGGLFVTLIFLGLLPVMFLAKLVRKYLTNKVAQYSIVSLAAVLITLASLFSAIGFLVAIGAFIGIPVGMTAQYPGKGMFKKNSDRVSSVMQDAAQTDSSWNKQALEDYAKDVFNLYQQCWSNNNLKPCKNNLTPRYYKHACLMVEALKQAHRTNRITDLEIIDAAITNMQDVEGKDGDSYVVGIYAEAVDDIIDTPSNQILFQDERDFTEYWVFVRQDSKWLLDQINQTTEDYSKLNKPLADFASSKGMFFSIDWGWLLLPARGQLFSSASFGASDINNHVIGFQTSKSGARLLTQIYNYTPSLEEDNPYKGYLVAQAYLPKSYGNILVREKKSFRLFGSPKGLTQVQMEWGEFNNKYEVWVTDIELATSFELLHPAFMQQLEGLPFKLNIEVVDNVLYLYSEGQSVDKNAGNYAAMLDILNEAFKQMKM